MTYKENVIKLLEDVRNGGSVQPFVEHMRIVVECAKAAVEKAATMLDKIGDLDNVTFMDVVLAAREHGSMVLLCWSFADDPSEVVRAACAVGEMTLAEAVKVSDRSAAVALAVKKRLSNMS